jgi:hypothetical protein
MSTRARVSFIAAALLAAGASASGAATPRGNLRAAEAFVARHCNPGSVRTSQMWQNGWPFNALYGDCGGGDGHDQRIWFFVGSRFVGNDARGSSAGIIGLWRDGATMAFLYVLYRANDPLCCATGGGKIVRYRWTGKRVVRLDPIPPRRTSAAHPVARYP